MLKDNLKTLRKNQKELIKQVEMILVHVEVVKNINNVVVNNAINPCEISPCKGFYNCNFYVIQSQKMALDKFQISFFSWKLTIFTIFGKQ